MLIDYDGRPTNGTVFDTSEGRRPTPISPGQVFPGFAEALTKMQKGGRYRIHIPAKLGYGDTPPPGSPIRPNSDLDSTSTCVQVVPQRGAMMQQMQQQPQAAQRRSNRPQP